MKLQRKNIALTIGFVVLIVLFFNHYSFTFKCNKWLDPLTNEKVTSELQMDTDVSRYLDSVNEHPDSMYVSSYEDGLCRGYSMIPSEMLWKIVGNKLLTADVFILMFGTFVILFVLFFTPNTNMHDGILKRIKEYLKEYRDFNG